MPVNSVMPKEKILVWLLTFSNACEFSDARRKIPGGTTSLVSEMSNSWCDFSDSRRKIPGVTTNI